MRIKKTVILTYALSTLNFAFRTSAQAPPTNAIVPSTRAVMTDSNSVLKQPTNFFAANSNLIQAVVPGGSATTNASLLTTGTLNAARLPASGVTAGTATKVTVDSTGRVTATNALVAGDIPTSLPFANGGSAASSQAGFITAAFGMTNFTDIGNPPTLPTNAPAGTFTHQLSLTTGGSAPWLRFYNGSAWSSTFAIGPQAPQFFVTDNNVFFWASNGVDNCMELRNYDNAHYSAMRFLDKSGNEVGAVGYGNLGSGYPDIDYLETFGLTKAFYFVAGGSIIGGVDKTTGDWIWNDSGLANAMFRVKTSDKTINTVSNVNVGGNLVLSNGVSQVKRSHPNSNTVNHWATTTDIDYASGNGDGATTYQTASAEVYGIGVTGHQAIAMVTTNTGWYPDGPQVAIGEDELGNLSNWGQCTMEVHGSVGTMIISTATNYTLGVSDSTVLVTTTGRTITLPSAASHCKYREYTIKLTASGSGTVATTSSQNIDGATTYSLSAQYKYVKVQSDGTQWWIIANN